MICYLPSDLSANVSQLANAPVLHDDPKVTCVTPETAAAS